jgi:hypothetical protein
MKRIFIISMFCTLMGSVTLHADVRLSSANFPDKTFRHYISALTHVEEDYIIPDGVIEKIKYIDVNGKEITSLKGVEFLYALTDLYCYSNSLTSLDLSMNKALQQLNCSGNSLTKLDVSNNSALTMLICNHNSLKSLNVSNNTKLRNISCESNKLSSIDVSSNTALTTLKCGYNTSIQSVDVSNNPSLEYLHCNNLSLTKLDVSKNGALKELYCHYNSLTSLDVSKNVALENLCCSKNSLTTLDVSKNVKLKKLYCDQNSLRGLSVLNNTELVELGCGYNSINSLNLSKNTKLQFLNCVNNQLAYLYLDNTDVSNYEKGGLDEWGCSNQVSTRRFTQISTANGGNDNCWYHCVGTPIEASRIRNLKIDDVSTTVTMIEAFGWSYIQVSKDKKKIPLKVTYDYYTGAENEHFDGWMKVVVNYHVCNYGVYIDGKELTSLNFYDIPGLKSGTAYVMDETDSGIGWSGYLPTLVLRDAKIEGKKGLENETGYYFKILAKGHNEIKATDWNAFESSAAVNTTIKGGDTLSFIATGDKWNGAYLCDSYMTIADGSTVICKGEGHGYFDDGGRLYLEEGATLMGYGKLYPSVELPLANDQHFHSGIGVRYPEKAYLNGFHVCYDGTTTDVKKEWVVIGPSGAKLPFTSYSLYVEGTRVTDENKSDVLGDKTVSYNPETKTLTLSGANISVNEKSGNGVYAIRNDLTGALTVEVEGENTLASEQGSAIYSKGSVTFTGTGTLGASGTDGLGIGGQTSSTVTVEGGVHATFSGTNYGFNGNKDRSGSNANIVVRGEKTVLELSGSSQAAFALTGLTLNDGLAITKPEGGRYKSLGRTGGNTIVDANGDTAKEVTIAAPYNRADVNRDGTVDSADIVAVIKEMPDGDMKADVNGDKVIDSADIVAVIKAMK